MWEKGHTCSAAPLSQPATANGLNIFNSLCFLIWSPFTSCWYLFLKTFCIYSLQGVRIDLHSRIGFMSLSITLKFQQNNIPFFGSGNCFMLFLMKSTGYLFQKSTPPNFFFQVQLKKISGKNPESANLSILMIIRFPWAIRFFELKSSWK